MDRTWAGHRRGVGLAVLVGLIQVLGTRWADRGQPDVALDTLGYLLLFAGPAALLMRRRFPVAALAVAASATVSYAVLPYPRGPFAIAAVVALFVAVRAGARIPAAAIVAVGYLAYVVLDRPGVGSAVLLAVWLTLLLTVAEAVRIRSEHFAQVARVRAEEARARAEQRRRQASEERLRIARELHDVIGHHLSLINVQAGVGLHLMDTQPEQARSSLAAIKQASAEALREVRSVLGALNPGDEAAPRAPAPSVAGVGDLVADVEAAGLPVRVEVSGAPWPLPPEVDRAAYRIIQEALTNVRRHGGPGARATVTIGYGDRELTVRVDDDGAAAVAVPSAGDGGGGAGLPGMRERATALGGSFTAGSSPDGGFRVEARLPTVEARLPTKDPCS